MLWVNYVIGGFEAVVIVASLWVLCRFPPTENESYHSSYALRPAPTVFKQLFYVGCLVGFLAVLVADIWDSDGYCLNSYSVWTFCLQIIYWSWSLQDPKCKSRGRLILFDVVLSTSMLVTLVVWLVLYPIAGDNRNDIYWNWISWGQHGINTGLLFVEFLWSDTRTVGWSTGALVTFFPAVYAVYAWCLYTMHPDQDWVYPFLRMDVPLAPLWYLALLGAHVALFATVACMAACKVRAIEETPERIHLLAHKEIHHFSQSDKKRATEMWEAYVIAIEEGIALGVSVLCLVVYPPHAHPIYACKYSTPSPWHRLFYVACAIFSIVVQVADVVKTHGHCFAFFTTWNFILQIGFWTWSVVDHRASSRLRLVLFDVLWPSSILVAVVVWGILYPAVVIAHEEAKLLNWISYCQHGINTVLLCIEWILSDARQVAWRASAFLVLFATVYVIFAWILHESTPQGFWPYPFLAIDRPSSPLVYLCLLVLQLVAFSVTLFGASLRSRAASQPEKGDSESSVRLLDEAA